MKYDSEIYQYDKQSKLCRLFYNIRWIISYYFENTIKYGEKKEIRYNFPANT